MKLGKTIIFFTALFCAVAGFSQEKVREKRPKNDELQSQGQQHPQTATELNSKEGEGQGSGSSAEGDKGEDDSINTSTPAGTMTTSPSGSPGVIADEHQPDGTNTVPSAKPNIAGAKVPGSRVVPPRQRPMDKVKAVPAAEVESKKQNKK